MTLPLAARLLIPEYWNPHQHINEIMDGLRYGVLYAKLSRNADKTKK